MPLPGFFKEEIVTDINSSELDDAIEQGGSEIIRDGLKQGDVAVVTGAARGFAAVGRRRCQARRLRCGRR